MAPIGHLEFKKLEGVCTGVGTEGNKRAPKEIVGVDWETKEGIHDVIKGEERNNWGLNIAQLPLGCFWEVNFVRRSGRGPG